MRWLRAKELMDVQGRGRGYRWVSKAGLAAVGRIVIMVLMTPVSREQQSRRTPGTGARKFAILGTIALGVVVATAVWAIDDASLHIDAVEGDGWSAADIAVALGLPDRGTVVRASIARLQVRALGQTLTNIRIECPKLDVSDEVIACKQARVLADWPALGKQSLNADLVYGRRDGALDVALDGLRVGDGRIAIQAVLRDRGWNARAKLQKVPVERLVKLAQEFKLPLPPVTAAGLVDLSAAARGKETNVSAASVDASFTDLTANNESGSLASDKLSLQVQASVSGGPKQWAFDVALKSSRGQAFAQPIFLDLSAHALALTASGKLRDGKALTLDRFTLDHTDVARASGQAVVRFDQEQPVRELRMQLDALTFPGAYESYLQPLLLNTSFESLQTGGSIQGALAVAEGVPERMDLSFDHVSMDDGKGTLKLAALNGQWHWSNEIADQSDRGEATLEKPGSVKQSHLSWTGGSVLGLALGASELHFTTRGRQFRLLKPARIPLLDGAIDLESLRIRNVGLPSVAFLVDATIQPISVQRLCRAFGWPEFAGRVGGVISKLRMREGIVTLGTTLRAQVFDGEVTISDLRLEQPFGQWPRFYSSIALSNLDLEPMTSAFSFGRITGRLSGTIDGVQLFNWTPVAFDAKLSTPTDDRSRHRISQRAVQNIGSIGGGGAGVTAALSGGIMRFFDDFNYDRLGISCRLENEICVMDGVTPAANGNYYLVKGKGLPRIDVIGSNRRVDWPRLVQQLIAVTESEGPVVQ
jgi:hypothetical protein